MLVLEEHLAARHGVSQLSKGRKVTAAAKVSNHPADVLQGDASGPEHGCHHQELDQVAEAIETPGRSLADRRLDGGDDQAGLVPVPELTR
jgi:hypothetical protein